MNRNHALEGSPRSRRRVLFAMLAATALIGCSTPYQDSGLRGGFTVTRLADDLFRVAFKGNALTSKGQAEEMTLLRSAQAALEHGFNYFVILDAESATSEHTITTDRTANTTGTIYGTGQGATLYATTTFSGGDTMRFSRPSTVNLIRGLKAKADTSAPVYDAGLILRSLGPNHGIDPTAIERR